MMSKVTVIMIQYKKIEFVYCIGNSVGSSVIWK